LSRRRANATIFGGLLPHDPRPFEIVVPPQPGSFRPCASELKCKDEIGYASLHWFCEFALRAQAVVFAAAPLRGQGAPKISNARFRDSLISKLRKGLDLCMIGQP